MLIQLSFADWFTKSIMQIKIDPGRGKTDSNFALWGFSKKESYVVHISFYTTRDWNSS